MILKTAFRHNRCAAELSHAPEATRASALRLSVSSAMPDNHGPPVAEDLARMKAGPTDAEVHHRFLTGHWPSPGEVDGLLVAADGRSV